MSFKPGDLFFTVIDFFSIVVPGALLLAVFWKNYFSTVLEGVTPLSDLFIFILISYLLGQIINAAASWPIDRLYDECKWFIFPPSSKRKKNTQLAREVRRWLNCEIDHLLVPTELTSAYRWSRAVLDTTTSIDTSHLTQLEAESKFFRSLILVIILYIICIFFGFGLFDALPNDVLFDLNIVLSLIVIPLGSILFFLVFIMPVICIFFSLVVPRTGKDDRKEVPYTVITLGSIWVLLVLILSINWLFFGFGFGFFGVPPNYDPSIGFPIDLKIILSVIAPGLIALSYWRFTDRRVQMTIETYQLFIAGLANGQIFTPEPQAPSDSSPE